MLTGAGGAGAVGGRERSGGGVGDGKALRSGGGAGGRERWKTVVWGDRYARGRQWKEWHGLGTAVDCTD